MFLLAGVLTLTPCVTSLNPEWKVHGGAKYAYFADRVTWEEAKAACNAIVEGGDTAQLASIFSKGEHDFITETLTRDAESGGSTWLGCTSSADRFNWVGQYDLNGKPQSCHKLYNGGNNFEYWHTNEPSTFSSCSSAYFSHNKDLDGNRKWKDGGCTLEKSYVCKIPYAVEWHTRGISKYAFIPFGSTWDDARASCKSLEEDSDLLAIEHAQEDAFVQGILAAAVGGVHNVIEAWMGCRAHEDAHFHRGPFSWASGAHYGASCTKGECGVYENWHATEPSNKDSQMCAGIMNRPNGGFHYEWNDLDCGKPLRFVCEAKHDMVAFKTSRYAYYPNVVSWEKARHTCNALHGAGADLLSVESEEEHTFVTTNLELGIRSIRSSSSNSSSFWTGCKATEPGSTPTGRHWSANQKACTDSAYWAAGEPKTDPDAACTAYVQTAADDDGTVQMQWASQSCSTQLGFVCEVPCQDDLQWRRGQHQCCSEAQDSGDCGNTAIEDNRGAYCPASGINTYSTNSRACPKTCKDHGAPACPVKDPVPATYASLHAAECCTPASPIRFRFAKKHGCSQDRVDLQICYRVRFTFGAEKEVGRLSETNCRSFATGSAATIAKQQGWDCFHSPMFLYPVAIPSGATGIKTYRVNPDNFDEGCYRETLDLKTTRPLWTEDVPTMLYATRCPNPSTLPSLPIDKAETCSSTSTTSTTISTTTTPATSTTATATTTTVASKKVADAIDPTTDATSDPSNTSVQEYLGSKTNAGAENDDVNNDSSVDASGSHDNNHTGPSPQDIPSSSSSSGGGMVGGIVGGIAGLLLIIALSLWLAAFCKEKKESTREQSGLENQIYDGRIPDNRAAGARSMNVVVNRTYDRTPSTTDQVATTSDQAEVTYEDVDGDENANENADYTAPNSEYDSAAYATNNMYDSGGGKRSYATSTNAAAAGNTYNTLAALGNPSMSSSSSSSRQQQQQQHRQEETYNVLAARGPKEGDVVYGAAQQELGNPAYAAYAESSNAAANEAATYAVPMKGPRLQTNTADAAEDSGDDDLDV